MRCSELAPSAAMSCIVIALNPIDQILLEIMSNKLKSEFAVILLIVYPGD